MSLKKASIIIELMAIFAVGAGIGYEIVYRAAFGFVLITSGAVLGMIGGFLWAKVIRK